MVYPTVETTVQLDPGNIACSIYSSNTCTVCISSAGFYSISITQTNVIGTSVTEATFDCKLKVIESLGCVSVNHWMFVCQFRKLKVDEVVYVGVSCKALPLFPPLTVRPLVVEKRIWIKTL